MAISSVDIKILWGRAGGRCSHPECAEDLTSLVSGGNYIVGEMAHVIGNKPTARRGTPEGGEDTYNNLILLCPTHHTHIDKAPEGTYPVEMLHEWKQKQESLIINAGNASCYGNWNDLKIAVSRLLAANKAIFDSVGPLSPIAENDPNSNMYLVWELRRIDRILPNNRKILNLIDVNEGLIKEVSTISIVEQFRVHAEAFEKHVYHRLDSYPLFPIEFAEVFS